MGKRGRRPRLITEDHFWNQVDKSGECWLWLGKRQKDGYGYYHFYGERSAHRTAYLLTRGAIPEGYEVCHNCPGGDNPSCVNPTHLWAGTHAENMIDKIAKGRTTQGALNRHTKLTAEKVTELRERYAKGGITMGALSKESGVSIAQIARIIRGERWSYLPGIISEPKRKHRRLAETSQKSAA